MTDKEKEQVARFQAEESLRHEGFLSHWIEKFVLHYREIDAEWVSYAREINCSGQAILNETGDIVVGRSSHDPICIAYRLLLRAMSAFQAAIILAERGIVQEADTLTRGIYEAGFWMGYLFKDGPSAQIAMVEDEVASQLSSLRFHRKQAVKNHGDKSVEVRSIDKAITEKGKGRFQNIEELAVLSGFENYYRIYKELSASAAHTSLHSLHTFLKHNGDGTFNGHIAGPNQEGIKQALSNCCNAVCMNLCAFSMLVGGTGQDDTLRNLLKKYDELGPTQPD